MGYTKQQAAPAWLTGKPARSYFYDRVKELPPLDSGQRELLAKASAEHESYLGCQHELEQYQTQHGTIFVNGSAGNLQPHPAVKLQLQHGEALRKWEAQLRLSLKGKDPQPAPGESKLDKFRSGIGFRSNEAS